MLFFPLINSFQRATFQAKKKKKKSLKYCDWLLLNFLSMVSSYLKFSFVPMTSNWALNRLADLAGSSSHIQSTAKTQREFLIFKLKDKWMLSLWHFKYWNKAVGDQAFWYLVCSFANSKIWVTLCFCHLENSEYWYICEKWVTDQAYKLMHCLPIYLSFLK